MKNYSLSFGFGLVDGMTAPLNKLGTAMGQTAARANSTALSLTNLQAKASAMSGRLTGLGGIFNSLKGQLLAGFGLTSVMAGVNKSINLWKIQEAAVANVESAIRATGNAAGISSKRFQEMASSLQENSIFGDEAILQNVTTQLLTFNNIKGEQVFSKAQQTVADLATRLDGAQASAEGLKNLSIMLGKVLQDPANMMNALARRGVIFSEAEQNTIKALVAQGQLQKAQLFMLDAISKAGYGGAAKDITQTAEGKALQRQKRLGDALEEVGKRMLPLKLTIVSLIDALLPALIEMVNVLGDAFQFIMPAIKLVKESFVLLRPVIKPLIAALALYQGALIALTVPAKIAAAWQFILNIAFVGYMLTLKAIKIGMLVAAAAQWVLNTAMAAASANPIMAIVVGVMALIVALVALWSHWDTVVLAFQIGFAYVAQGFDWVKMKALDFLASIGAVSGETAALARQEYEKSSAETDRLNKKWAGMNSASMGPGAVGNKSQTDINIKVTGEKGATAIVGGVDRKSGNANINTRTDNGYTQPVLLGGGIY
jgi:energy-converting hydrogenase Eha subunit C